MSITIIRNACCIIALILLILPSLVNANQEQVGAARLTASYQNTSYQVVSFSELFFQYKPPMDIENPDGSVTKKADKPIEFPQSVKNLNHQPIALKGFVMPLESDGDRVKSFLLVDQLVSCLFCQGLGMDQWVLVTVKDPKGVKIKDEDYESAMTVYGTIEVGEKMEEQIVTSIYRMDADGVVGSKKGFLNIF